MLDQAGNSPRSAEVEKRAEDYEVKLELDLSQPITEEQYLQFLALYEWAGAEGLVIINA